MTQNKNQLGLNYSRRARVASGLLGLSLVGATASTAEAQPARAKIEHVAAGHEALNPQAYIAMVDKQMEQLREKVETAPGVQVLPGGHNSTLNEGVKILYPGCHLYTIGIPSKEMAGRYDQVSVLVNDKVNKPILEKVAIGVNSAGFENTYVETVDGPSSTIFQSHLLPPDFTPNSLGFARSNPTSAYVVGDVPNDNPDIVSYADNPEAVKQQINTFFGQANVILSYNLHHKK